MRKYIMTAVLIAAVLVLGACGSQKDKVLSNIETFEEDTAPALTETIQSIIDHEAEMTGLFNESLTDKELADFKNNKSALYDNLKKRKDLASGLSETEEALKEMSEEFASADVSKIEGLTKEQTQKLADKAEQLKSSVKSIREGYGSISSAETTFFEALGSGDADYNTMRDGMAEINELHEKVKGHYGAVNEQLQAFNNASNEVRSALGEGAPHEETAQTASGTATEGEPEKLYTVDSGTSRIVPSSDNADPEAVLITIDDAPDENAVEMAHTLKDLDAPAIFFVNGMYIESEEGQEKLREIHELGFAIGNHTYNHFNLQQLTPEDTALEIVDTNDLIEEVIGERPVFFRAPFGVNSKASIEVAEEEGMTVMNWTYGFDWEPDYQEPAALADIMVNTEMLGDGANLLMHDRTWTSGALADIVNGLRDKGFTLVDPASIDSEGGVTE